MDRTLVAETPFLQIAANRDQQFYEQVVPSEWRNFSTDPTLRAFVHESSLDLGGYTRQDDLTVFFRASFEQISNSYLTEYSASETNPLSLVTANIIEQVIITSVPMNDGNLEAAVLNSPGFIPPRNGLDQGNFDRTHIIHGHYIVHTVSSTFGSTKFETPGEAILLPIVDEYYSSLEPTAADTLYVYRIIYLSRPSILDSTGFTYVGVPARRIILDTMIDEESELSYMMRLKRSYELANQV
jgi:hypothetical protein